jgi:hypothetical protein
LHWRKFRSNKYKTPAGRLLEFYESDSLVEADEDSGEEVGDDVGQGPNAGGIAKPQRRTRSAVGKRAASSAAAAASAVKAAEKKKKEEEEGHFPSNGCYIVDSDAPLKGGRVGG